MPPARFTAVSSNATLRLADRTLFYCRNHCLHFIHLQFSLRHPGRPQFATRETGWRALSLEEPDPNTPPTNPHTDRSLFFSFFLSSANENKRSGAGRNNWGAFKDAKEDEDIAAATAAAPEAVEGAAPAAEAPVEGAAESSEPKVEAEPEVRQRTHFLHRSFVSTLPSLCAVAPTSDPHPTEAPFDDH